MPIPPLDVDSAERQTIDEIREWHRGVVEALVRQHASILNAIRSGSTVAARFMGMTEADVDANYDAQRRELDRLTIFNLVAGAEATVAIDYFRRVRQKLKDRLSRAYQAWHNSLSARKQLRPDFDESGILHVLKRTRLVDNNVIGQFRECVKARHRLGHGRRWRKPIAGDRFDPDDVYDRAQALLRALPP